MRLTGGLLPGSIGFNFPLTRSPHANCYEAKDLISRNSQARA